MEKSIIEEIQLCITPLPPFPFAITATTTRALTHTFRYRGMLFQLSAQHSSASNQTAAKRLPPTPAWAPLPRPHQVGPACLLGSPAPPVGPLQRGLRVLLLPRSSRQGKSRSEDSRKRERKDAQIGEQFADNLLHKILGWRSLLGDVISSSGYSRSNSDGGSCRFA